MVAYEFRLCDACNFGTFLPDCWLCGGRTRFVGFRYPHHQRIDELNRVTGIDLWRHTSDEVAAFEARLVPCPLCDGEGLVQHVEERIWAECPHCWGTMYRTRARHEPFDPRVAPDGYDVAKGVETASYRNRIQDAVPPSHDDHSSHRGTKMLTTQREKARLEAEGFFQVEPDTTELEVEPGRLEVFSKPIAVPDRRYPAMWQVQISAGSDKRNIFAAVLGTDAFGRTSQRLEDTQDWIETALAWFRDQDLV